MANIKDPSGSFYLDSSEFNVDYVKNKISLVGGAGGGSGTSDITADGGTFNADAVLQGTDNLQITVPDAGESATVGVTPESVTISHNTNSDADGSIRVTADGIELKGGDTTVQINGTGVDFGGGAVSNVTSIGNSAATEIAFESDMDMNNHSILNIRGLSFVGQDNFVDCETGVAFISTNENNLSTILGIVNGNSDPYFISGITYQEDDFNGTVVINNNLGTTSYFGKQGDGHIGQMDFNTFEGLTVDSNGVVTIKSNSPISFNNGIITNVANPVNNTDAVNKQYADSTYAPISSIPTTATTSTAGIVKQISNIAQLDASTATTEEIATTVNSLLTALQNAGIMSAT